jgi:hypothetical protein
MLTNADGYCVSSVFCAVLLKQGIGQTICCLFPLAKHPTTLTGFRKLYHIKVLGRQWPSDLFQNGIQTAQKKARFSRIEDFASGPTF